MKKVLTIKDTTVFFTYLLIVWGFYRLLLQVPDPFDEVMVKPLVWLLPVYFLLKKEKLTWESVGVTSKNAFKAIYFALFLGFIFAFEGVLINFMKYDGLSFAANVGERSLIASLLISFVVATSEEIAFRGYIFSRLKVLFSSELRAALISSVGWVLIHMPIAIFDWKLAIGPLLGYLLLVFAFGFASCVLFARTKNILSSILLHVLWAWPIILFR